jgi:hypothetical protein
MNQQIMDMAQAEFNRAVMNNLGIYMIAEAWGIRALPSGAARQWLWVANRGLCGE